MFGVLTLLADSSSRALNFGRNVATLPCFTRAHTSRCRQLVILHFT